ncbi:Pentatricopeptide repeat-containing protein [Cocos nucifera]|nr:Pentatricopeptide repeat-containing protein [Cocos nucifera]
MASLPSFAVNATLHKLDPDARKLSPTSLPIEKSLAYQRSPPIPESSSEILARERSPLRPENSSDVLPQPLDVQEAIDILREGNRVESVLYVPLLQQCIDNRTLPDAEILHAHIIKTGTREDLFVSTSLVNVYMKCGATGHARKLFDKLPHRNIVTWTALITGYVHNSRPDCAVEVFIQLLESGVYPTNYTLGAVLSACCALYSIEIGEQVHGYMIKYGIESNTSMGNSLCSLYSKCGSLESAVKAFQRIPDKNVISWTTVISACGDQGDTELGLRLFIEMLSENVEPNEYTLTSALSLCCMVQDLSLGKQVHSFCIKFGCEFNVPVKNAIMYLYLKCGEINEARRLFDEMETVSLITWNAMIAGHAQMMNSAKDDVTAYHSGTEALRMFLKLNRSGMKPDLFSFSSILSICSGLVALEQGEQIHAQTIKSGFLSDVVVSSALVNMYNKCGCIEKATKAFVEMSRRTMISWTSMITGYSQHGRSREAIQLFEDMRLSGSRPNQVTFVGVLSACSHGGMVDKAEYYFNMMKNEYGIEPVMDHYACMVDMFVRLGRLEDAFAFVKKMHFEPNEIIWSILIAGCRSHGNMELGFYAAERLLELKPRGIETYVLLLNMYISAERWHDVSRVRKLMKDEKIGNMRDRSWISIKDKIYYFRADDRTHTQSAEMYEFLESLLEKAKGLGYVPYKSVEISDDEDEEKKFGSTIHHSERLAIIFGLINMAEDASIRVVKNITMCRDCHSAVKFFSLLTKREIIVRDSKRLHKFIDGQCSCGDFGALL